jgi:hypothetical protein
MLNWSCLTIFLDETQKAEAFVSIWSMAASARPCVSGRGSNSVSDEL